MRASLWRAGDVALERGPDNLRGTRKTIQPERTIVRSNRKEALADWRRAASQYFRYSPISLPWILTRLGGRMRTS